MNRNQFSKAAILMLAFAVTLCLPAEAANVIRGPYVQNGTPTSMTLCWRTDVATNSRVSVGTVAGVLTLQTNNASSVIDHEIIVSGLTANTKYYYTVGTSTGVLAGGTQDHFFITNPAPGTSKPTRIWAIGDAGTGDINQANVRDAYYNYTGVRHTDLWLQLGDNAYQEGNDAEYQANVFNVYNAILQKSVTWPTRGNHETTANTAVYYGSFVMPMAGEAGGVASGSEAYYSFNYGRVHLICLDSVISSRAVGSPMLTWLASDLAANTMDWTIAYWHHPPYSKGSHDSDTTADMTEIRTNVLPILEAGGVDLVLGGHSHSYERSYFIDGHYGLSSTFNDTFKVQAGDGKVTGTGAYEKASLAPSAHNGAVYIVAGSSGKLSGVGLHPAMYSSLYSLGSVVLDINGNHLDATFLNEAGAILDNFRIIKGPSGTDTTSPVLVAGGVVTLTRIDLAFSEAVTSATANALANYTLTGPSGAVTISSAVLQGDGKTVRLTVPALTAGATYTLVANNVKDPSNNTIAVNSTLTLVAPGAAGPAITTQPANATVTLGATATFTVVAPGATNYQWKKNGVNIPGATSASYTTPPTVALDNGSQFTVVVGNATGTTLSAIATLVVNTGGAPITVVHQDGLSGYAGTRDTYLNAIAPNDTVSWGTQDRVNVNWGGGGATENTIGLLQFDLSSIPSTATITSATVDVWLTRTNGVDASDVLVLDRVTSAWTEALTYAGGVPTSVPSGIVPPSLAGIPNASPLTPEYKYSFSGLEPLVQGWVSAPATNMGMKITCATSINFRFASSEHPTQAIRPMLTVTYTTGGTGSPPVITVQPLSQTVTEPATATFTVNATGATSYQWQRNGTNIAGATSASYTTSATTVAGDNGALFRVLVTNANGTTTSNNATLTVNPPVGTPPVITTQPASQTVTQPATATFTVVATGATSYQWQRNGTNIAGATSASYTTLATTVAGDNGAVFRVLVTNANGTTTSNNATLTVNPPVGTPPVITTQPASQTVTEPATATFTVVATGATSYQWQRNGTNIAGATSASYTTPPTNDTTDNGALFRVLVTNASGTTTSNNATLTVNPPVGTPPVITTQPASQTVTQPATATFTVVATGATSYQWQRNGTNIAGATSASYTTAATTVAGDNGAIFRVLVTNASGTSTSNNATLTVNPPVGTPPVITAQPASQTVTAPATATFTVSATGATSYQWQRNGTNIAGATSASYTTAATTVAGDNGAIFRVLVTNASGTTTSNNATLTVNASATNPVTLNVTSVTVSAPPGSTTTVVTTIVLTNTSGSAVTVTPTTTGGPWLTTGGAVVVPAGGTATLTIMANPTGQTGIVNGTLTLTNSPGGQSQTIPVSLSTSPVVRKRSGCSLNLAAQSAAPGATWLALLGVVLVAGWVARRTTSLQRLS